MQRRATGRLAAALTLAALPLVAHAAPNCAAIERFLTGKATGVVCFHSDDLRTNNPVTTPPDNSITTFADGTTLPGFAAGFGSFTPTKDRGVISNGPAPTSQLVPGIQVEGWFADDPTGQARFVLRFPDGWNGKLVVAGASGTRSEYNGDFAWSDYVLPKGYAYASQNKGVLNFYITSLFGSATQPEPFSCRVSPTGVNSLLWVHFYDVDPQKPFTQWTQYMLETAQLAQSALKATYNKYPSRTYAVGTSNGGYQVRRAVEEAPNLFDGGVDWEGTYIDPRQNILIQLPVGVRNFPDYVASGYDANSPAAKAILAAGFPPDIVNRDASGNVTGSLWQNYYNEFWEVTACQWQQRFDPTYPTYSAGLGNYDYRGRLGLPGVFGSVNAVTTTGKIKKPLITVAGTMDALLPIKDQARAYEAAVDASRKGNNDHRNAQYRLYEVQNGNHIEAYVTQFSELVEIQPHAQKAFDLLVAHVENNAPLPPSQCIPKGGTIASNPAQPGNCTQLFAP
ncbi:MAG TPA: 3-hydroxybutyrate oligomer hydrolase family protein [Casimicrobiaceae bacterium]|nr:3-hydroxybutyrate oligomer hydrolase family protein [Casimicrobiaceae bacterium]